MQILVHTRNHHWSFKPPRTNKKKSSSNNKKSRKIDFFQYRNFDWRNQGDNESCKVTTIVNTNHFPQNLKKQYRFSLAIVLFQSGSHLHSGDRLFEWPKLSEKMRKESTYGEIYNSISTRTFVLRYTQIFHNLIGWTGIVCILFALQQLFDDLNHFTRFFQCKTDK